VTFDLSDLQIIEVTSDDRTFGLSKPRIIEHSDYQAATNRG